jgi:hypothetical protein
VNIFIENFISIFIQFQFEQSSSSKSIPVYLSLAEDFVILGRISGQDGINQLSHSESRFQFKLLDDNLSLAQSFLWMGPYLCNGGSNVTSWIYTTCMSCNLIPDYLIAVSNP